MRKMIVKIFFFGLYHRVLPVSGNLFGKTIPNTSIKSEGRAKEKSGYLPITERNAYEDYHVPCLIFAKKEN